MLRKRTFSAEGGSAYGGLFRQFFGINLQPTAYSLQPSAAFTLVELMVVLAIVAMLAGLLAMTIRDSRERARTINCRNNLRQFGIAIGKYMTDQNGWFIRKTETVGDAGATAIPAAGGGIIRSVGGGSDSMTEDPMDKYTTEGVTLMSGGVGDKLGYLSSDSYSGFINSYVRSSTTEKDVTFCPEVNPRIFQTNSPYFKGKSFNTVSGYRTDSMGNETTYAINGNAIYKLRSDLKDCMFAFIDWNAAQGWGATISWSAYWEMEQDTVGSAVTDLYKDAGVGGTRPLKDSPSYYTEVGFHHRQGTNLIANYVAMDGHVSSIRSNAPQEEFHRLFFGY